MDDIFDLDEDDTPVFDAPREKTEPSFLKDLNPEQYQAVTTTEGPVLVLSGAGTGKTRVLTTRIAYIMAMGLARPWEILAVTFTNKAAKEMKERLEKMVGADARTVWLGTFHSIGVRILGKAPEAVGLKPNFVVLGTDDQERLLKQILQEAGVDIKKYTPAMLADVINRWKDRGLSPSSVTSAQNSGFCEGRALGFYQVYQQRLRDLNAVDFGDLLLLPLEVFKNRPDILAHYQNQFRYILVDEYQDTNVAQYMLLRLLSKQHGNLCCVGDDDQSIYSWRGAEVANILGFEQTFSNALIIRLERNYRSTEHILGAASALISNNTGRLGKTLKVADDSGNSGDLVKVSGYWNGADEADKIVQEIEVQQAKGTSLSDMAILVRASFQTREFEETLIRYGVPYKIIGGFKFYEREEIRDAVAYLRLVLNQTDDLAFLRIVNKPRRGIGEQALSAVQFAAKHHKVPLFEAVAWAELRPAVRKTLDNFTDQIKQWNELSKTMAPAHLATKILEDSGYMTMWRMDKSPEAEGRIENIKELYNVLGDFASLNEFLEYAALITDTDDKVEADQLVVMTLHASKGLEFDTVFLPGWEDGLFPHQKALDETGDEGLEEERRLAYVGLTRAKKRAYISFASSRRVYGQWQNAMPSRFVDELPSDHILDCTENAMGRRGAYDSIDRYVAELGRKGRQFASFDNWTPAYTQPKKSKRLGKRVFHDSFGYGTVIREEGDRLEVHFDDAGPKKVLSRFLEAV
ncbi:MAG: UvrD-helicase domain-containing protein [Alphaproteobacteria bacterium]|nr:UvrD-helicase domain-containing protein [Alphaproteobacteria bacterium]